MKLSKIANAKSTTKAMDTGRRALLCGAAVMCLAMIPQARAAFEAEKALLAKGEYAQAIEQLEAALSRNQDQPEGVAALLAAWNATGEYRKAAERGEQALRQRADAAVAARAAEALMALGEYERAESMLEPFSTARALYLRATLSKRRGDAAARDLFQQASRSGGTLSIDDQRAVARALMELGLFREANQQYQASVREAPEDSALLTGWGQLMAAKHNPGEAEGLYRQALAANPKQTLAMVGLAELAAARFQSRAPETLRGALEVNPQLPEARLLLARIDLERERYEEAASQLDEIEKLNPQLLEAWSLRATAEYLQGRAETGEREWLQRILGVNPSYGKVFEDLGDFHVIRRQYALAADFYRQALEKDPSLDNVRANLGIQVFRLGEEEEARRILEESYRRDPFNVWTVNTLRLMDSFENFDQFENERFRVKLHKKESALLWPYVEEILEESLESITSRYGYVPRRKVIFEMYPDHDDFAVRTLGLPGLGALGASFGPVVAMDSPSARPTGAFHWGSTLWHELGHVITLGITSNRVPRWFTEGLSVYEEANARPGWGDPFTLGLVRDLQRHGLVPIEKLEGVFVHPEYPSQVTFAYFQSGMICEFIAETYGFDKIVAMLRSYEQGHSDAQAIGAALGMSLEEFDAQFREYARVKTYNFGEAIQFGREEMGAHVRSAVEGEGGELIEEEPVQAEGNFMNLLRRAAQAKRDSKLDEAEAAAEEAKRLFPPYAESGNPYELLAEIHEQRGDKAKAVEELMQWRLHRGRSPATFKKLATLLDEAGRRKEAIQVLEDSLQVAMYDLETHTRLGEWLMEEGDARKALRAYRGVLSLNPPDKAEAHYRLATAYRTLQDLAGARREILQALEIAPGYRAAQQLLLELTAQ